MATESWVLDTLPKSTKKDDLLAYFGVPPYPESSLEENIKAKRQFWGKRSNGPEGRELAEKVKRDIQNLSLVILKGQAPDALVVTDEDGKYRIVGMATTVEELCLQLAELLRQGDVPAILKTCKFALNKWDSDPEVTTVVALTMSDLVADDVLLEVEDRRLAEVTARKAIQSQPNDARAWLAIARTTLAFGSTGEIDRIEASARKSLGRLDPALEGVFITSAFRGDGMSSAIERLIKMIREDGDDASIRSWATDLLLKECVIRALPIKSKKEMDVFAEMVEVAAWCAQGVPEAELDVMPYRIWAVAGRNLVYVSDYATKAVFGVLTGFLSLPIVNRLGSEAGWKILANGPLHSRTVGGWISLTSDGFVEDLHKPSKKSFDWRHPTWGIPGNPWPNHDQLIKNQRQLD